MKNYHGQDAMLETFYYHPWYELYEFVFVQAKEKNGIIYRIDTIANSVVGLPLCLLVDDQAQIYVSFSMVSSFLQWHDVYANCHVRYLKIKHVSQWIPIITHAVLVNIHGVDTIKLVNGKTHTIIIMKYIMWQWYRTFSGVVDVYLNSQAIAFWEDVLSWHGLIAFNVGMYVIF